MIRIFFILFLLLISSFRLFSQTKPLFKDILFGLQFGGNISKLDSDTLEFPLYNVFLPDIGINTRYKLNKKFSLQGAAQLSGRGLNNDNATFRFRTMNLDFQMLAQYNLNDFLVLESGIQ